MNNFILGMNTMGFLIAGLFFLRFWQKSSDLLFAAFSAAFVLFALDQLSLAIEAGGPIRSASFLFRLSGFALLIAAVLRKNLK
jgi:hypothetical protein